MKIILRPKKSNVKSKGYERVTIQFKLYDESGVYLVESECKKGNETIHLKDCSLSEAFEIVKASLMSSRLIDERFEVE